jgi:putative FmdB family regulatory protein
VPTYQYACTDCGHRFEQFQAFSDASLTDCPVCGGKLRKVYGSVGVVFKGSGFYRTDSRTGAAGTVANAGEKSDAGSSASPDSGKAAAKESGTTATKSSDSGSPSSGSSAGSSSNGSSSSGSSTKGSSNGSSGKPATPAKSTS